MKRLRVSLLVATIAVALAASPTQSFGRAAGAAATPARIRASSPTPASASPRPGASVPGVFLVKVRPSAASALAALDALPGVSAGDVSVGRDRTATVRTPKGKSDAQFLRELRASPQLEYAEPNYIRELSAYAVPPNDPGYLSADQFSFDLGRLWFDHAKSWWLRDINGNSGMNIASLWGSFEAPTFPSRASGSAIKVAVIDSGLYSTHPDAGTNILGAKDEFATYTGSTGILTTDADVTPVDPNAVNDPTLVHRIETVSHGTCVAGQISAATNNGVGVAGVSYDSTVLVYKVQGIWIDGDPADPTNFPPGCAVIFDTAVINAIRDATDAGAKVINMSLAGPQYSAPLQDAIDYAWAHGVLVVAATGNGGGLNRVGYPGANNHVVGVGSYVVDGSGGTPTFKRRSSFTDYGIGGDPLAGANNGRLDLLAPGEHIWGLIQPGYDNDGAGNVYEPGYFWWDGTSMASPAFAGTAAMMWRFSPQLTNDELATLFFASATNAGTDLGYGYVNPTAAYAKLKANYPYLLAPATLYLPPATNNSAVPVSWTAVAGRSVTYDVFDNSVFQKNVTGTSTSLTLGEGTHVVSVTPRSLYNWWDPATSKSGTVNVNFSLTPVSMVGTVTVNGSPLSGVSVSVPGTATVTTSAGGTYTVGGIFPGTHTVTYSKPGYVTQTILVPVASDPTTTAAPDVAMVALTPVYRFFNKLNASHFYTASEAEKNSVIANLSAIYTLDGVAYKVSSSFTTPLHRFFNKQNGSHFYTASEAEKNNVIANLSATYSYDGVAYKVSQTSVAGATPVYRFFNKRNGSHFYTASAAEKNNVIANLSATYALDGIAFYVVP